MPMIHCCECDSISTPFHTFKRAKVMSLFTCPALKKKLFILTLFKTPRKTLFKNIVIKVNSILWEERFFLVTSEHNKEKGIYCKETERRA